MPIAILVFGPLADVVSVELLMIVSGTLLAFVGLWYGWLGKKPALPQPRQADA